jgi:hypothetical protein
MADFLDVVRHDATNGATALWAIFLHLKVCYAPPAYVSHGHRSNLPEPWHRGAIGAATFRWRRHDAGHTARRRRAIG